jgi:hypothetical protein
MILLAGACAWIAAPALVVGPAGAGDEKPAETAAKAADAVAKANPAIGGLADADAKATGTIAGVVRWAGDKPKAEAHKVPEDNKDRATCGASIPYERHIIGPGGELANVIVSIEDSKAFPKPKPREIEIANVHCRFAPHVQATTAGSKLHVSSKDEGILHSANAICLQGGDSSMNFNLAIPNTSTKISKTLRRPATMIMTCATHGWMQAFVQVFSHDFFAVTGEDGKFEIRGVPPGEYKVRFWHETTPIGNKAETSVKVEAGKAAELKIDVK